MDDAADDDHDEGPDSDDLDLTVRLKKRAKKAKESPAAKKMKQSSANKRSKSGKS